MEKNLEKIKDDIIQKLDKRGYQEVTIKSYSSQLLNLFSYYPAVEPTEITNKQVCKYAQSLISKNYSASTVRLLFYACSFYFDEINNKNHGLYKVKLPPEKNIEPEFFLQSEVLELIEHKKNLKHKSILLLMYSCGLETGELLNLQVNHIRSREQRPNIHIIDNSGKLKRKAFLSKRILPILREYYQAFLPEKWFFYSQNDKNKKYSPTSVRKMIDDSIADLNLNPRLKSKSLRHSYIKHMNELGIPLPIILNHLGLQGFDSHLKYAKLLYPNAQITYTPLDKRINENTQIEDFKDLEHLVFELEDQNEIDYLLEGIECFRIGSLRAGVIFIWSAAIKNIRQKIIETSNLKEINQELQAIDPKAKQIKNVDSFEFIKDETTLLLSQKIGLYDKFEKNELSNACLGLRNKCGHPSNYKPEIHKVKAFVEDVLNMVYKKKIA